MIILFTLIENKLDTCADKKNPLVHGGTSQWSRYLDQLKPDYISVNEKSKAQWVAFTAAMAERLNYFNDQNLSDGVWSDFFNNEDVVNYAKLSLEDVDALKKFIQSQLTVLQAPQGFSDSQLKDAFTTLCSVAFTVCVFLDQQIQATDKTSIYNKRLVDLVTNKLRAPLTRLLSYYKAAVINSLTGNIINSDIKIFGNPLIDFNTFLQSIATPAWFNQNGSPTFSAFYSSVAADASIFAQVPADLTQTGYVSFCLNRASRHSLFTGTLDVFLYACSYTQQLTAQAFTEELNTGQFPAHLSLYLTFLQILQEAQKDLNQFTERHLDFFYRQVLQLAPLPAVPNQAHVTVQLGSQVDDYLLPAGTLFKAGKDDTGKDVSYSLLQDTVFNKSGIGALKSFYLADESDDSTSPVVINEAKAFASDVANSLDGEGKPIKDSPAAWQPFGNKTISNSGDVTMLMPTANLGFAIASQYLYLQEGTRQITIRLYTDDYADFGGSKFRCELTTTKGWSAVNEITPVAGTQTLNNYIEFDITLDSKFPAVTGYSADVHGPTMITDLPVVRFFLDDDDFTNTGLFASLRDIVFTKCAITVSVGTLASNAAAVSANTFNGLKTVYLSNNMGALDTTKPFSPFGTPAQQDNFLTIGCRELFLKPGASYQVIVEHTQLPDLNTSYVYPPMEYTGGNKNDFLTALADEMPKTGLEYLNAGTWINGAQTAFYDYSQFAFLAQDTLPMTYSLDYEQVYDVFSQASTNGFVKVTLTKDFGSDAYQEDLIAYRIDQAKGGNKTLPEKPYAPVIKTVSINYTATAEIEFGTNKSSTAQFVNYYHIHPFGARELTNTITEATALLQGNQYQLSQISKYQPLLNSNQPVKIPWGLYNPSAQSTPIPQPVFPQFDGTVGLLKMEFISELYVALSDAIPDETVNILFQVLDGSTNPLVAKPVDHVFWFYLRDDDWVAFDKTMIRDNTAQLINSGIISFDIPGDATLANTLLPAGYIWLKAAIAEKPDAVCKLIDVLPQAALLQFQNNQNAADFQDNQLPAGSIAKLVKPLSAIKQIVQPYESFGGKPAESTDTFRVRISERIRHKDRAIQIDDYEKLILQQFPGIQKAKCLNHTRLEPDVIYNEQAPGHVTIITIPYINKNNSTGILKPYTSTSALVAINDFLSAKISPHVTLHVENPLFEEILLDFNVSFFPGYDKAYYANLLRQEIMKYLSPWAFDDHAEISFGGEIYKSTLINFIEGRSYVDFITNVKMFIREDGSKKLSQDSDTIIASTARSVLVSAPAESHNVNPL